MIAFEVYLNGKKLCVAGIKEFGGLSAVLTWQRGPHVPNDTAFKHEFEYSQFTVWGHRVRYKSKKAPHLKRGFKYSEHLEWITQEFPPGNEVTIKAVEVSRADKPRTRKATGSYDDSMRAYKKRVREMVKGLGWKIQK